MLRGPTQAPVCVSIQHTTFLLNKYSMWFCVVVQLNGAEEKQILEETDMPLIG